MGYIRDTSIEAFNTIKENGLLSQNRQRVYSIIFKNGPLTGAQVAALFYSKYGRTSASETIRNRITELRNFGVVKEVGKTIDVNTAMKVLVWDVTSKLPIKLERKAKTKCQHCNEKDIFKFY
jgi:hypothetical protein